MIDLDVPYVEQVSKSDCWYAALEMIVTYHHGPGTAFVGHPRVRQAGQQRNAERQRVSDMEDRGEITALEERDRLKALPLRGLNEDEFKELADLNGLTAPTLPARDILAGTGGWTATQLETLLRDHGPLWCAISYTRGATHGHVIVVKGIDANDNAILHDPEHGADLTWTVDIFNSRLVWAPHCVMYLPHAS